MESWENKIIRDKIDSLQRLPDSYLPDLSSKWEIIEAGLPVKKKSRISLLVKWSVAAAFIVGVLLTGIEINRNKNVKKVGMTTVNMPSLYIPLFIQERQVAAVTKPMPFMEDTRFTCSQSCLSLRISSQISDSIFSLADSNASISGL